MTSLDLTLFSQRELARMRRKALRRYKRCSKRALWASATEQQTMIKRIDRALGVGTSFEEMPETCYVKYSHLLEFESKYYYADSLEHALNIRNSLYESAMWSSHHYKLYKWDEDKSEWV